MITRAWYFSVEDWNGDKFYLASDGSEISEDAAQEQSWKGDQDAAMEESERRANLWERRTGADAAVVMSYSMRRVGQRGG